MQRSVQKCIFSREPRLYKRVCPSVCQSVCRSVCWSVRRLVMLLLGGQRRAGERLISCIQTCFLGKLYFFLLVPNSLHSRLMQYLNILRQSFKANDNLSYPIVTSKGGFRSRKKIVVWGSRGVGELRCWGVAVWGSCVVGESHCGKFAL